MQAADPGPEVVRWLAKLPGCEHVTVEVLRRVIDSASADVQEIVYHDALGYSLSGSGFDRILYIARAGSHLNLGFFFGATLADPERLLRGEGKRMRHIKVAAVDDARNPAVHQLIRHALDEGREHVERRHHRLART